MKDLSVKHGTCGSCFMVQISPNTVICPVCQTTNPYITFSIAVSELIESGNCLTAVGFIHKFRDCSISKAIEFCKLINPEINSGIIFGLNDLIDKLVKERQRIMLAKLIKKLNSAQFGWGIGDSKEFVDTLFPAVKQK